MKNFIVYYICVALWVSYVERNEVNLKKFLSKIQGMTYNISSKMANIDRRNISIIDFFEVENLKLLNVDEMQSLKKITTKYLTC